MKWLSLILFTFYCGSLVADDIQNTDLPNDPTVQNNMVPIDLPKNKPQLGERTLLCVSVHWMDDSSTSSAGKASSMCNQVREFYSRNSRSLLDIKVKGIAMKVPFNNASKNFNKVKSLVKSKYPNMDMYALVVGKKLGASHAGQGTAFLRGYLYRDAQHEIGHLLGLGHAGRYEWEKNKWVLHAYNDGESVMGRFPSSTLTGPQYRWVGWLPKDEVAVYDETMLGKEYEIKRVTDTKLKMLSLVGIPVQFWNGQVPTADTPPAPNPHRDAFLSFNTKCDSCLSLHLSMGGGSQKVGMFGNEFYDTAFTGIHVKVIESSKVKIKFTIDWEKKPPKKVVPKQSFFDVQEVFHSAFDYLRPSPICGYDETI